MLAELQSALRRELETGELLDLEEDFYDNVQSWLTSLSSQARSGEDEAVAILVDRAKETVKKLFLLRLIKGLRHVWTYNTIPEKRLPKQEAAALERILSAVSEIVSEKTEEKGSMPQEPSKATVLPARGLNVLALVYFKKPYPKLVLSNGKLLGPFSAGDIAVIPLSDTKTLTSADVAEVLTSFVA